MRSDLADDHRPNGHAPDITGLPSLSGAWRWLWYSGFYDGPLTSPGSGR